ncbi:MAG: phosphoribosylformylglycinamidine synthase I, partial [Omnitrophica bacterium GWA2_52_8]
RTGAIARFSPAMEAVRKHAGQGRAVLGICNGFQILLEAGMLPGAMLRNKTLSFICKDVTLRVETRNSLFTRKMKAGSLLTIPIAHGEGNYTCDDETFKELAGEDRIVFRYAAADGTVNDESNPNGSRDGIAGILNKKRNVLGMMPHPERSSEEILSGVDGRAVWESILAEV